MEREDRIILPGILFPAFLPYGQRMSLICSVGLSVVPDLCGMKIGIGM